MEGSFKKNTCKTIELFKANSLTCAVGLLLLLLLLLLWDVGVAVFFCCCFFGLFY